MTASLDDFADFCSELVLDSGKPMLVEPFQREALADYFAGAVETLILLVKKQGKTTLMGALALFHLLTVDDAECVVAASSRDQATILYDQARGFVRRSPALQKHVRVKGGYREIQSAADAGRIRVLAADVDTADGVIPTLALVDELHRHKSADLYGIFRDGLGPRGGQMITISTAGDRETSPLGQMRQAARSLPRVERDGAHLRARSENGKYVMHEWALDVGDDVDDMEAVKRANPASWWTTELLQQAHDSPSMLPWQWARFRCGLWTGAESWWVRAEDWHGIERPGVHFERGDRIALGFDGSRHHDATGLVGCRLDDGLIVPLGVWEAPKGVSEWDVPTGEVDGAIANAFEHFDVVKAYFDPPLWQTEIDSWAREYGDRVVIRYSTNRARFMQACERFRTDVIVAALSQNGDERLTRHVLNAQIREVRGGYYLDKPANAEKIDLAVASVLAYEARCDALAAGAGPNRAEFAFL